MTIIETLQRMPIGKTTLYYRGPTSGWYKDMLPDQVVRTQRFLHDCQKYGYVFTQKRVGTDEKGVGIYEYYAKVL